MFRRRRERASMLLDDVWPHLRSTVYITGAFGVAWSWNLVFYGASHVWAAENPLQDQLSFGNQKAAPKWLWILLLEYLVVCGGAAVLSDWCQHEWSEKKWNKAAITAVEFVPSPVFAGKLMAYLSKFSGLGTLERALINLGANLFAASLAFGMPYMLESNDTTAEWLERFRLRRFPQIVQDTLGFGLGIAWNVFLAQFAPSQDQWNFLHFIAFGSYLLAVSLIAFRLAAVAPESPATTIEERMLSLAAFAMYVVVAFTLVALANALFAPAWIGALESLLFLLALSAIMSALVTRVDLEDVSEQVQAHLQTGPLANGFRILAFVPCVWCCCPWILVLWLLAGHTQNIGAKEHWFKLIAMVSGLASSIEASGMLTEATDELALALGICNVKHCRHPWLFVLLQTSLAVVTTCVLLPLIAPLSSDEMAAASERPPAEVPDRAEQGEEQSLLSRFIQRK